jgi:hypothetical protein
LLDWSGFLTNSHDPLRVHVLKHVRQNSLTSLRYSVVDEGMVRQKSKAKSEAKCVCGHCPHIFGFEFGERKAHTAVDLLTPVHRREKS